jgi:hypothetical protein
MKILTQMLLLAALAALPWTASGGEAQDFDVLKAMSVADFRAAGLDKLSDGEIKSLDAWFQAYQRQHGSVCPAAAAVTAAVASPAVAADKSADDSINARLVGDFRGWSGGTLFKLDNGQVWEQTDDSELTVGRLSNPRVTISRGLLGAYYLSVEGVLDTVTVKRIKP